MNVKDPLIKTLANQKLIPGEKWVWSQECKVALTLESNQCIVYDVNTGQKAYNLAGKKNLTKFNTHL